VLGGFAASPQMFFLVRTSSSMSRMVSAPSRATAASPCAYRQARPKRTIYGVAPVLLHDRQEERNPSPVRKTAHASSMSNTLLSTLCAARNRLGDNSDAAIENVVMAALDHVDGVDLHIAEMRYRVRRGCRPLAETALRYPAAGLSQIRRPGSWSGGGVSVLRGICPQSSRIRALNILGTFRGMLSACPVL